MRSFFTSLTTGLGLLLLIAAHPSAAQTQPSVARQWNEALLDAIRNDFARPTVHARNLFHSSVALYDAWAVYDEEAQTYLLGRTVGNYTCAFRDVPVPPDLRAAQEEAMSYAAYRLLSYRFRNSPGAEASLADFTALMTRLGYDVSLVSTDYTSGSPAALGNYLAQCITEYGMQDGANEALDYANTDYLAVNPFLFPFSPGNPLIADANRWQPLRLNSFIDQGGNITDDGTPPFLSPEWGRVAPFALTTDDLRIRERDGKDFWVYHDPGPPPYMDPNEDSVATRAYQYNFALVSAWSSHLDPADSVMWDISPASTGNLSAYPTSWETEAVLDFYPLQPGGGLGPGYAVNPRTGQPYEPQLVPRGDFTRVLAEFWADGPDSETPPGHWFTILNHVSDHPQLEKRFRGEGPLLDALEWDVKAYLTLGGAMHDAAVSAWGIKGWYDYLRPISAIRFMGDRGQSSDPALPAYSPYGLPLIEGFIELVGEGDPLVDDNNEHLNKIKVYAWRGPNFIQNPDRDVAGVGWILAENWWPYQRPSFVTPPFAGYVSGHSTFSRAAAEVLTRLTGDAFFPGGLAEFEVRRNRFLVFEEGPSVDMTLQWATYRDASDQTSLSRIWGGIHPPADDFPGRRIGEQVGIDAFALAERYFSGLADTAYVTEREKPVMKVYPNPARRSDEVTVELPNPLLREGTISWFTLRGQYLRSIVVRPGQSSLKLDVSGVPVGLYFLRFQDDKRTLVGKVLVE